MSRIRDGQRQAEAISAFRDGSGGGVDSDTISIRSRHTLRAFGGGDEEDEAEVDAWSALPRRNHDGSDEVRVLSRSERRRMLVRALVQLIGLFVVCLVGLGGMLWLALPVIAPEDRDAFKLPRSFEDLQNLNRVLQHYKTDHFGRVMLCWIGVYMFLQAFSIPGSMYMSILAGALFGVPLALPLVCASVASGATICYLISRFLGVVLVALPSWQKRVEEWKEKLAEHRGDMLSYLIVVRMMPLPPHNVVNILSPHLGIGIGVFWISTFCGIFAVSLIHTTIGEKLDQMSSPDDFHLFSLRNILLLVAVGAAVLTPVVIKKYTRVESLDSQDPVRGPLYLDDDADETEARLPPSFRRNLDRAAFDDDDDDELPPRSLDTHNIHATAGGRGVEDDSFPSWHDDAHQLGPDGVFADRSQPATAHHHPQPRAAKLKAWIGANTGLRL